MGTPPLVELPLARPSVPMDLDLRGQRAEEALGNVESYLDELNDRRPFKA